MTAIRTLLVLAVSAALVGCGSYVSTTPGEQVDVTGKVTGPGGKSVSGFQIVLQPTGGGGQMVFFPLKADGSFSGKANAGTYTYYLQAGTAGEAALEKMPKEARAGSLERTVEVKAGGGELQLKL
jgi:hypothetical protein